MMRDCLLDIPGTTQPSYNMLFVRRHKQQSRLLVLYNKLSGSYYTIKSLLSRLNAIRALVIQIQVQPWSTANESSRSQGRAFDKLWRLLKYIFGSPSPPPPPTHTPLLGRTTQGIEFAWTHAHCHHKIPLDSCNICIAVNVIAKAHAAVKLIHIQHLRSFLARSVSTCTFSLAFFSCSMAKSSSRL